MGISRVCLTSKKNVISLGDEKERCLHLSIGLARTTSVQSDSSGFADADNTLDNIQSIDLDWESLKVYHLDSTDDDENNQPLATSDAPKNVKDAAAMATKGREGILRKKRRVVSEKKVTVSQSESDNSRASSPSYVTKAFIDSDNENRQVSLSDVSEVYMSVDGGEIKEIKNISRSRSESSDSSGRPKYRLRYSDIVDDVFDGQGIIKADSVQGVQSANRNSSPLLRKVQYDSLYTQGGHHKIIKADVHQEYSPKAAGSVRSKFITRRPTSAPVPSGFIEPNNLSFAEELAQASDLQVPAAELKVVSPDGKDVKVIPLKERVKPPKRSRSLQDREIQTDEIAQPELLASLIKQSGGWTPGLEALTHQGSWTMARKGGKPVLSKHIVDENELVRQALDKYKDDLRILEVQAARLYGLHKHTLPEADGDIESIQSIRKAIWHEVHIMSKLLRDRRYSLNGGPDLASLTNLSVVQMMISLLKEQLFHNDTLDMMDMRDTESDGHVTINGSHVTSECHLEGHDPMRDDIMRRLAEVQTSVARQHNAEVEDVTHSLKGFRDSLLAEIKASIRSETQQLQEQVKATERQIKQLNTQLSISSLNSSQDIPDHYIEQYTTL